MDSIENKIKKRIYSKGKGSVFTPRDFVDLGSSAAVRVALQRLKKAGHIRSISRGLYDFPKSHSIIGELAPSADAIAKAIAGKENLRIQPSGAYAANLLGLSEQVPMKIVFLTDGYSKTLKVGNQEIIFKATTPRNMGAAGRISGLVIQALRYMGKNHSNEEVIEKLRRKLNKQEKVQLLKDAHLAPAWIGDKIKEIVIRDE